MVKAIRWPFAVVLSALLLTACAWAEPTRTPTTTQIEVTQTTPDTEATIAAAVEATIAAQPPTANAIAVSQTTPDTEATVAAAVEATIAARFKISFTP